MEPVRLTTFNALSTAADLWIVSDIQNSKWTQEVDYYINFQITKAQSRSRQTLDPHLEKIISTESVENSKSNFMGPLMIVPHSNLPAKCILYLSKNEGDWIKKANDVWNNLNCPSVKIFVPVGITGKEIQFQWTGSSENPLYFIEE